MPVAERGEPPARAVGRALRLVLGIVLVWMAYGVMRTQEGAFNLPVLGAVAVLTVSYTALHVGISKYVPAVHPWFGAFLALLPVVLLYVLGGPIGRVSSIMYIGMSLALQGIRSDGGCEVMSIPSLVVGKRTHLVCIVFSPLDWLEGRVTEWWARSRSRGEQSDA